MADERSQKHEEARSSLPEELQAVFNELVADYKHAATIKHGSPFVSYVVLADLVKMGWRSTGATESNESAQ